MTKSDIPSEDSGASDAPSPESDVSSTGQALGWWDASTMTATTHTAQTGPISLAQRRSMSLLAKRPHRSPLRPAVLVPVGLLVLLVIAYCTSMAVWPLTSVEPQVSATSIAKVSAAKATLTWPKAGSAAVAVNGSGSPVASSTKEISMASITKLVTVMLVLDKKAVTAKDQGPTFRITYDDVREYWNSLSRGESALPVPSGETMTEYQLIEGALVGSANNYARMLANNWWSSNASFARAATDWLADQGIEGITIVDPTGIEKENTATPAAVIELAQVALSTPVVAEIVKQKKITLPGAGEVHNTNELLKDTGVVGVKTGTLEGYNVVAAKNVTVGGKTVQIDAVVLHQPDSKTRWSATRSLFTQVEKQLQTVPSVPAGTTVGTVHTRWGATTSIATTTAAPVILWNGESAQTKPSVRLGGWTKGAQAGTLTVSGLLDSTKVPVALSSDLPGPGLWWRITHPFALLGLDD